MRPGNLRHYLTIKARADVPDEFAGIDTELTDPKNAWGEILPAAGLNLRGGAQITEGATHRITIRHYPGLTNDHEFECGGLRYQIKSIIQDPLKEYTQADCVQITA